MIFFIIKFFQIKFEKGDPSGSLTTVQQINMTIADSVWLGLYMTENENMQHPLRPLALAWAEHNFQHLKVLKSINNKLKWSTW
jgi:hypothetical protein